MSQATDMRTPASVWTEGVEEMEAEPVYTEVERTEVDEIAVHTMTRDGEGSIYSIYWSRERAVEVARQLLNAAAPR